VDQIVGPTADQVVTLITCNGTFNSATHQYDKRLVIRAERFA
jgi:sortase (surface protein transpeptidase)